LKSYWIGLIGVLAAYVVIFATFLIATDGLPYVFDNNETFSSIVHAYNLLTDGVSATFGLTDESFGRTKESGPYLYTHQGNFPRFFALLIYWLGAHSGEAQIVVTTFTVGLAAIFFAYEVAARRAGPVVGAFFCVLMMTDYLMVMQWQVNAWRVWHMFFFFLSLLCIEQVGISSEKKKRLAWFGILLVEHAALFYFELIFAAFTAATTGFYAIFLFRRRLSLAFSSIAAQALGMLLGVGVLVAQLLAYFGWDNFLTDLRLTFLARNESIDSGGRAAAEAFMIEHKIAFWYNVNEMTGLREPQVMLEKFFSHTFGIYTPTFVAIAAVITISIGVRQIFAAPFIARRSALMRGIPRPVGEAALGIAFLIYAIMVIGTFGASTFAGLSKSYDSLLLVLLVLIAYMMMRGLIKAVGSKNDANTDWASVAAPVITLLLATGWLLAPLFGAMAGNSPLPLWSAVAKSMGPGSLQLLMLSAGWLAARIAAHQTAGKAEHNISDVGSFLIIPVCAWLGYTVVYMLSPGYILTGYLYRFAPFITFANLAFLAAGCVVFAAMIINDLLSLRARPWWQALTRPTRGPIRLRPHPQALFSEGMLALVSLAALIALPSYWAVLQTTIASRASATQYSFMPLLSQPPFKGASFAVGTYAAPIATATEQWAYYDSLMGYRRVETKDGKSELVRDLRYLWFADRDNNPAYLKPDYYLCITLQDIATVLDPRTRQTHGCSQLPLVRSAGTDVNGILRTELAAQDPSGKDRWAIVRLHWIDSAANAMR